MSDQIGVVRRTARQFCRQLTTSPYLSYTEHGLHALFFTMLYDFLPAKRPTSGSSLAEPRLGR